MKRAVFCFAVLIIATGLSQSLRAEKTPQRLPASLGQMNPGVATLPLSANGELELGDGIKWLLEKNFSLRVQALDVASAGDDVLKAWGDFDPKYFASSTYEDNLRRLNALDFSSYGLSAGDPKDALFKEVNLRNATGFQGTIPGTGTQYELSTSLNRLNNTVNEAGRFYSPEMESFAGISLTQSLLKNFWFGAPDAQLNIARLGVQIANRTREVEVVNKMIEFVNAYYDMVYGLENVKVKTEAVDVAVRLRTENEKRVSVGKMIALDVTEADVKVSEAREELILAEDFLRERRLKLLKLLVERFEPGTIPTFTVSAPLDVKVPAQSPDELVAEALAHRPDYLMALEQAKKDKTGYNAARSARLPQLDLKFSYGLGGLDDTPYQTYAQIVSDHQAQWSAGAVFSMPIGNVKARAEARIAKRKLAEDELNTAELHTGISLDVSNALERLSMLQRRLETATTSRTLATQGLDVEQNRLEAGQTTSFSVLDFQRKVSEARTRELAARVDLKKAEAELWASIGLLPKMLGVEINPPAEPQGQHRHFFR
jgi:outer membrane protein TolC